MANGIEVAKAYVTIVPEMSGSQQAITEEMTKAGEAAGDKAGKAAGSSYSKSFGEAATSAGKTLTASVTAPIVAAGTAAVKKATDYNTSLAKVSTIADDSVMSMAELSDQIKQLSTATGIGAADIAESVYSAISAGQDTADAVGFVAAASNLAKGGFTSAAAATDVLTTALNAYGLEADQVGHVSDVLIGIQNAGKTTVDELASSMGKVIPTAKAAGVGLEDLGTAYVALTKNGIATAEATTYINGMLNELNKTGSKSDKAFRETAGVSFKEYMESGHSVAEALQLLDASAKEAGMSMGDMFGSSEAAKAANVLSTFDDAAATLNELATASGITEAAVAKINATQAEQFARAQNNINNLLITLGDSILPVLEPFIQKLSDGVQKLAAGWAKLSPETQQTIVKLAGVAAAAGPVLLVLGKVSGAVTKISGGLGAFGKLLGGTGKAAKAAGTAASAGASGFGALAGEGVKLLLAAAGFVAIAFGISLMAKAAIELGESGSDAWISLGIMTGAIVVMVAALAIAGPALTAGAVGIAVFAVACLAIGAAINIAGPYLSMLIESIGNLIVKAAEAGDIIANSTATVVGAITGGIATVVDAITGGLANVINSIANVIDSMGESALKTGEGFKLLADGLVAVTSQTGVIDLGATLGTIATGLGAIIAEAALGGDAVSNLGQLGSSFVLLATNATTSVATVLASITLLQRTIANTRFEFPRSIKLPHFTASAGVAPYGAGGGTPPAFSVQWYDKGGIFTQPTIIGVGEKRPEAVGALDDFAKILDNHPRTENINLSGVVRVEGYNSRGEFDAVVDNLVERLRAERRLMA